MKNLFLKLAYDGTNFHGWQYQPNADTVQGELLKACERIFNQEVQINGCSRTDTGVHAKQFCATTLVDTNLTNEKIKTALNAVLPSSISIISVEEKDENFHARFDCVGKEYVYRIINAKHKNPFETNYALYYYHDIDEKLLNECCQDFVGTHDFSAFCASGCTVEDKVRTIYSCGVKREGEVVTFTVRGDGFLYNMVRIMVGTVLYIAQGKIEKDAIPMIISSRKRENAGITAKAHGLYLNQVFYDEQEMI